MGGDADYALGPLRRLSHFERFVADYLKLFIPAHQYSLNTPLANINRRNSRKR